MFKIEQHRWHWKLLKLLKIAQRVTGRKTECHSLWHFHDINVWENGEWRPARRRLRSRSTNWHLDRWVYWFGCLMELCVCVPSFSGSWQLTFQCHIPAHCGVCSTWLSIRPMNAVTMMHVWLQLLICTFKYQCKCITVLLLFEFQWRKEEAAVILNSWLWVQVLWAPVERNWRRITWTGHTANCWGGWHGADTAHWQSASEVKWIKCSSNIWFSIWFDHLWRAWLGSVLGAPVSSAVQELLAYRFNLQANGIDWKGLDVVMLINELIKCYFITLSLVQPLAMNTKQMQSSESQVSNWTTVPVASIRSLTLHWCSFF